MRFRRWREVMGSCCSSSSSNRGCFSVYASSIFSISRTGIKLLLLLWNPNMVIEGDIRKNWRVKDRSIRSGKTNVNGGSSSSIRGSVWRTASGAKALGEGSVRRSAATKASESREALSNGHVVGKKKGVTRTEEEAVFLFHNTKTRLQSVVKRLVEADEKDDGSDSAWYAESLWSKR